MDHTRHDVMDHSRHNTMILLGGWSMILFAVLFVGITLLIDNLSQSQVMLYGLEDHSLYKAAIGSGAIRALFVTYAALPLLLIPAAVGCFYAFIYPHEAHMRCGMYFATAGALALSISLFMLPSLNWHLVTYISHVPGTAQEGMIAILQGLHSYFGVFIGDVLGFGCILVWMFITSLVMIRTAIMAHVIGVIELVIAIIAAITLILRLFGLFPIIFVNIQAPGLIALWLFICGIGLVSLRRE